MQPPAGAHTAWMIARLVVGAVVAAAVVAQGISTISAAVAAGQHVPTATANFFSYFTILSNAATASVLAWAGLSRLPRRRRDAVDPPALAASLVWVTTYMLITCVVYNLLLRAVSIGPDTVGWANEVMHVGAPLFLMVDLLFGTGHRRVRWRVALATVLFPLAWIAYTLVRAPLVTAPSSGAPYWYPYPFLDPYAGPDGWGGVVGYIVAMAAGIIVVAFGVVAVLRLRFRAPAGTARSRPSVSIEDESRLR
ncbi:MULTISPECIES: Pr6Pr family membrane protein [Microbacterium]|uniref:Pr6Pr family membrane protein n=1 Tax=Microbacterium TaxID=33882 RepID=UPI001FD85F56|nr:MULTISPECIES: Pr6Pr family membrane protein [Microbacterium]